MPTVVIDGVEYVPKAEIPELTDERLLSLETRYSPVYAYDLRQLFSSAV